MNVIDGRVEVRGLDADPLLHQTVLLRILRRQLAAGLEVDVPRHRARLEQLEAVVVERGELAQRLAREVRSGLVLALREVDDHELVRRVRSRAA